MMQTQNKFFDDLSKVLNGAAGTFAGMAREAQDVAREKAREFVNADGITREEFDALKDSVAALRAEIAELKAAGGATPAPKRKSAKGADAE